MTEDARFEDGAERPLRLRAETAEDLAVISALVQDAVGQTSDVAWMPRHRRFTLLLNRFRWEDSDRARRQNRAYERVRSLLNIEGVTRVKAMGVDPRDRDLVISLLSLGFEPGEDGSGILRAVFAGDGEITLDVECLSVTLTDVTRPHQALAGAAPRHSPD
jgi:hypothetical protein